MDYDKMTIKSLANDCFEDSFYKINAADLESRIQYLCDKYHQDKLDNLSQHLVSGCISDLLENAKECLDWMEGMRSTGDCGFWEWEKEDGYTKLMKSIEKYSR